MRDVEWLPADWQGSEQDAIVAGWFEDAEAPEGIDGELAGLALAADRAGMVAREGLAATALPTYGRAGPGRLVVVGLGARAGYGPAEARKAAAVGARAARRSGARTVALGLHAATGPNLDAAAAVEATVLGARRGLWRYDGYRTTAPKERQVEAVGLLALGATAEARKAGERAMVIADSVALAREIDILGSNDKYPSRVAERAEAYAAQVGLDVQVLNERDLGEMGAGLILGVGQGSEHPPRMVVLRTGGSPGADGAPVLALVGKGITFDSGGISLKPGAGMGEMKYDLCGAIAVMAALGALARLGSPIPVIGIMCLAENLPGGSAQRPGDVVKSLDGQTVEVDNTDAEGRLVMADGLALARRLGATHLVDAATLTGACVVALGHAYSGLMGNDQGLIAAIQDAAGRACERVWPLPLDHPMYRGAIRSDVADMRNVGGRAGGAITAGAFLRRFAHDTPWAHLDIAGTAWLTDGDSASSEAIDKGPTGVMVETFVRLPERLAGGA